MGPTKSFPAWLTFPTHQKNCGIARLGISALGGRINRSQFLKLSIPLVAWFDDQVMLILARNAHALIWVISELFPTPTSFSLASCVWAFFVFLFFLCAGCGEFCSANYWSRDVVIVRGGWGRCDMGIERYARFSLVGCEVLVKLPL